MGAETKITEIAEILDMQSELTRAFINKKTAETVVVSTESLSAVENDEDVPSWQEDEVEEAKKVYNNSDYIELPEHDEIDGYEIMEDFCFSLKDEKIKEKLLTAIQGRGAFRRFKENIRYYNVIDEWYDYKQKVLENIARDWCEANNISLGKL